MAGEHAQAQLTSVHNPRVKQWAALLDKKGRAKQGQFLAEGVHLVQEALLSGAAVDCVVYDAERGVPHELEPLQAGSSAQWIAATEPILAKCTGTDTPPRVFAVVAMPHLRPEQLYGAERPVVVLDAVADPGNVGTIIRAADAAGAAGVVLGSGCADPYNPKTVRSTMGSLLHLPVIKAPLPELLGEARRRGARLVGTALDAERDCYAADWTGPVWLVLGSESRGMSPEVRELVDESVLIPIEGRAESLNVAMAGTILLYEALRQRTRTL
ncbi:RNA methyltransferase [Paenibacillus sp. IB182496]|uniref:RNA methyltransferase n=1 Tax=Paenibacillus sabuli TaxID=2772509 RepID=A0A927GQY7_9BACL|nr:RNA methyltransferase [Paenibacillus sabuli]MBD2844365.1 RNA methyltransferase [Paenibacillus sabuli]